MIRILVDSASDYTPAEAAAQGLLFAPLNIHIGEETYVDGLEIDRATFYDKLTNGKDFPKTSQPSPQTFLNFFEEAKENGDEVICLTIATSLSGTYQSAALAKSMAEYDKIYLIDTNTATICVRVLAEYGCKLIAEGLDAPAIVEKLEALKSRVHIYAVPDTLEYLARGGRISKAVAAIGELAKLKPILSIFPDGTIGVVGKCIGRNKAISFITNKLLEANMDPDFPLYTLFSSGESNCEKMEQKLAQAGFSITSRQQMGATIGTHVGPELYGYVYVEK